MGKLHELYKGLISDKEIDYRMVFPDFFDNNGKVKVLYICPRMDSFGIRNMFIPAIGLMNTPKVSSCIFKAQKSNNEHIIETRADVEIPVEFIKIANIVVFPFCDVRLRPLYAVMREINPRIKICFIVDFPIQFLKDFHYSKKAYKENSENIHENIYFADKVFIPNEKYNEQIKEMVDGKYTVPKSLYTEVYNTKMSNLLFEDVPFNKIPEMYTPPPPYRVGFFTNFANVQRNEKEIELIKFCQKNKDLLHYVIYGCNPYGTKRREKKTNETETFSIYEDETVSKLMDKYSKDEGNGYEPLVRHQPNDYIYHLKNIYKLGLSVAVVMPKNDAFFTHSIFPTIIEELAVMQIPVITNIPLSTEKKEGVFYVENVVEAKKILKGMTQEISMKKGEKASEVFSDVMLLEQGQWIELEKSILSGFSFSF